MSTVLYHSKDGIGYITLNRPEKLNTLSNNLIELFVQTLEKAEKDSSVKAIVLHGAGRAFSAGGDLEVMQDVGTTFEAIEWFENAAILTKKIRSHSKHIVAAVHGHVAGAGFSLALAADYIVAKANTKFNLSFVKVGLVPDLGLFQLLLERVPINIAKEWISFAPTLTAEDLLKKGVVNRVTDGELLEEASAFIQPLTSASPLSLNYSKRIFNSLTRAKLDESILLETVNQSMLQQSEDYQEGVKAFFEKRKPKFKGR